MHGSWVQRCRDADGGQLRRQNNEAAWNCIVSPVKNTWLHSTVGTSHGHSAAQQKGAEEHTNCKGALGLYLE